MENSLTRYRVALADYEDDDGCEQVNEEYLLKPHQTKGDLVKELSYNAGFIGVYVHDECLATPEEIERLANTTFGAVPDDSYENYGAVDVEDWN